MWYAYMKLNDLKRPYLKNGYRKEIDHLTESIINKVVRQHVKTLKKYSSDPERYKQHVELINSLYDLDED